MSSRFLKLCALGLISTGTLVSGSHYVTAQTAKSQNNTLPTIAGTPEKSDEAKQKSDELRQAFASKLGELDKEEITHYMALYGTYNIHSMVKSVRNDIKDAVDGCVENNPDMEEELNGRFQEWDDNIGGTLEESYANMESLALAQNYMTQNEVQTMFKNIDETRDINSSRFETVPVTTPEACEFMLSKMDETEDHMDAVLRATLRSYPNLLRSGQE